MCPFTSFKRRPGNSNFFPPALYYQMLLNIIILGVFYYLCFCVYFFSFYVTLMPSLPNRFNFLFLFCSTCAQHSIAFYLTVLFGFLEQNKHVPEQKFEARNYMQIGYKCKTANSISLRPRPHVYGYFRIRNFFVADRATVHTYTANSTANP